MRPKLYFLFKGLLCFLLLYGMRDSIELAYRSGLELISKLLLVDVTDFICGEICSLRLVAYLALVISTPKIDISRRLLALLVGLTVFVSIDLAGFYLWSNAYFSQPIVGNTLVQQLYGFVWNLLRDLFLPLLLWVVVLDRHLGLFFPNAEIGEDLADQGTFSGG